MARRIVITGGGSGIGRAIAFRLLTEDPEMVLIGRREGPLEQTARDLSERNPRAKVTWHSADLADPQQVQSLADDLKSGPAIDVLVNNAGGNFGVNADGSDLSELAAAWRADFDGNMITTLLITQALLDHIQRPGHIIAMSSVAAIRGSGSYGAAKAGINAWMWWMSSKLAKEQITVNSVAPGFVPATDFWQPRIAADPTIEADRIGQIPMGRPGTPEEVAEAVAYLASPQSGWTTGQILQVNGGTALGRG